MRKMKQVTSLIREYKFNKEELKILKPLWESRNTPDKDKKQRTAIDKDIENFVTKNVLSKLYFKPNVKHAIRWSIPLGWVRIKELHPYQSVTRTNYKDVVGIGPMKGGGS